MKQAIAFLLMVFSLTAISSFAEERGGVGVGNGRSVFKSESGFMVSYSDQLTLNVLSKAAFEISNLRLVNASEKVSKIEFVSSRGKVASLAEAVDLFRARHPGRSYELLRLKGAEGLASEERTSGKLSGIYYIVTSDLEFVEITVEAYAHGNGLALIAPIVHTFTYDRTPPRIHRVQFAPGPWKAGGRHRLRMLVTDDNSGMAMRKSFLFLQPLGADGKFLRKSLIADHSGDWKAEGNDWYSIEIDVGRWVLGAEYKLSWLSFTDAAGNVASLWLDHGDEAEYSQPNGPNLPAETVPVVNGGTADVTPPELLSVRKEAGAWQAGRTGRIYLEVGDDVSGIDLKNLSCTGLDSLFNRPGQSYGYGTGVCANPRHEGGRWYSLEVAVTPYQAAGEYFLVSISLRDRAGNTNVYSRQFSADQNFYTSSKSGLTKIPVHKVRIENDGREDKADPELLEVRTAPVWKAGTKNKIFFRARDNLSGIRPGSYGWLLPVNRDGSIIYTYAAEGKDEGNGWYSVEIEVSPWAKGGEYYLGLFSIGDNARNGASLRCDKDSRPAPCENTSGPQIPQIFVRIER